MRNDDVRWTTKKPHLLATAQGRRFSLLGHIVRMPEETNAKILTASLLENWRSRDPCTKWMKTIQHH